mgnify:CR=1 FL=1
MERDNGNLARFLTLTGRPLGSEYRSGFSQFPNWIYSEDASYHRPMEGNNHINLDTLLGA